MVASPRASAVIEAVNTRETVQILFQIGQVHEAIFVDLDNMTNPRINIVPRKNELLKDENPMHNLTHGHTTLPRKTSM